MKKMSLFLILFLLFLPHGGSASVLTVKMEKDLTKVCQRQSKELILGCLSFKNNTIYLRTNMNKIVLNLVLTHELGHWILQDVSFQTYQEVFGIGTLSELEEKAANRFYDFLWYDFSLTPQEKEFFKGLMPNFPKALKLTI